MVSKVSGLSHKPVALIETLNTATIWLRKTSVIQRVFCLLYPASKVVGAISIINREFCFANCTQSWRIKLLSYVLGRTDRLAAAASLGSHLLHHTVHKFLDFRGGCKRFELRTEVRSDENLLNFRNTSMSFKSRNKNNANGFNCRQSKFFDLFPDLTSVTVPEFFPAKNYCFPSLNPRVAGYCTRQQRFGTFIR